MPDTEGFQTHLPDPAARDAPGGWGEALAALPQEAPAAGGWQRLQARLPGAAPSASTRAGRARWPAWGALAASLALAVAIPLQRSPAPGADAVPTAAAAGAPTTPAAAAPRTDVARAPAPARAAPVPMLPADAAPPGTARLAATVPAAAARARRPAEVPGDAPVPPVIRTLAPAPDTALLAGTDSELDLLQGQSAQLEHLLALARDERVSSGTTAALGQALDAQLASIDAALVQPGLEPAQRTALWRERVDALQQLAGIETTNRLYAARGQAYDVALVSVD